MGRLRHTTGPRVDYLPFQDPQIPIQFPGLTGNEFETAVHLILPDGTVHIGAGAVFRALASNPDEHWLLDLYEHSAAFASASEAGYRLVARNRTFFSAATRVLWGRQVKPPTHHLVRWLFLRALGIVYLIAFLSLWTQITGLVGHRGIAPAENLMRFASGQAAANHAGLERYHLFPTLCWFSASDSFLEFQCAAGTALAVLVIIGLAQAPCLFLLWLIYLSLTTVGGVFLGFQWDSLLLETGFMAVFLAPLQLLPQPPWREADPSRIVLWLLRWLLFRLLFESGMAKLAVKDPAWSSLTALKFHFETQPLPAWTGWYAHQLPTPVLKAATLLALGIELAIPFLIFLPRRPRLLAATLTAGLQALILLTGNSGFLNWLTLALCLPLLDDAAIRSFLPIRWQGGPARQSPAPPPRLHWPLPATLALAAVVASTSMIQFFALARITLRHPDPAFAIYRWVAPLHSFNSYGLFASMTTNRQEIIIEGSDDGVKWAAYEFRSKPGNPERCPGWTAAHQPRLEWQLWFAALGTCQQNPWFIQFSTRLLQGSPEVLALLKYNPFPSAPPRFIRAELYDYKFNTHAAQSQTGCWWQRKRRGIYLPPLSLPPGQTAPG